MPLVRRFFFIPLSPTHLAPMGLYDRDYGRSERTPWDRIENPRSIVTILIVVNVIAFVAQLLFTYTVQPEMSPAFETMEINEAERQAVLSSLTQKRSHIEDWFAIQASSLPRPWLWYQTLTYGFLHDTNNIFHIVFNMLLLFIFGRPVEQRLGGERFLKAYLASIVIGGFVTMTLPWLLAQSPMAMLSGGGFNAMTMGASGGVVAMIVMFACYFPHQEILFMMVFPMKAWVLAVIVVVGDLVGALGLTGAPSTAFDVHLAGALFGFLYVRRNWDLKWLDLAAIGDLPGRFRQRSRRAKLKLHDPEKKIRDEAREADRILAKIHESGESSLTRSERRTLERYSRRQRQKREI